MGTFADVRIFRLSRPLIWYGYGPRGASAVHLMRISNRPPRTQATLLCRAALFRPAKIRAGAGLSACLLHTRGPANKRSRTSPDCDRRSLLYIHALGNWVISTPNWIVGHRRLRLGNRGESPCTPSPLKYDRSPVSRITRPLSARRSIRSWFCGRRLCDRRDTVRGTPESG